MDTDQFEIWFKPGIHYMRRYTQNIIILKYYLTQKKRIIVMPSD